MAEETPKLPTHIPVRYKKAVDYGVKHADGVWGSITPTLEIQMAFFSHVMPLPTGGKHEVTPEGTLGRLVEDQREVALDREVSVSMVFNPLIAVEVIKVLQSL